MCLASDIQIKGFLEVNWHFGVWDHSKVSSEMRTFPGSATVVARVAIRGEGGSEDALAISIFFACGGSVYDFVWGDKGGGRSWRDSRRSSAATRA